MQRLHFTVGPGKRRDLVGHFEQPAREIVPRRLVLRKCGGRPLHDRARQQFRVSQCVRDAVGGERIFEVPGVADERPPGPGAALDETDMPAEPTYRLHPACLVKPRVENCRDLANQPAVCQGGVTVNLGAIRGGTKPNLVADACAIDLDCRHPPGTARADVEALLRTAFQASGEEVDLELFHEVPPASVPADADHVRRLRDLAGGEVIGVTYGTEMAYYAPHNPRCAVFGPGEPDRIHVPDERVSLAETVRVAEIYAAFARAMAPSR